MEYTIRKLMALASDPIVQEYLRCMEKEAKMKSTEAFAQWMNHRCQACKGRANAFVEILGLPHDKQEPPDHTHGDDSK